MPRYKIAAAIFATSLFASPVSSQNENLLNLPDDFSQDMPRTKIFRDLVVANALRDDQANKSSVIDLPIPKDFLFPDDADFDRIAGKKRENSIFLIDISHYTGKTIDFSSLKIQSVQGVYIKATQGSRFKDALYGFYTDKVDKLTGIDKIRRGAYHFLTAGDDPKQQAYFFLTVLKSNKGIAAGDLPPCVDFEWDRTSANADRWDGQSGESMISKLKIFLDIVAAETGRIPIIYTAKSFLIKHGIEDSFSNMNNFPLWIADYSRSHKAVEKPALPKNHKEFLWQFADNTQLSSGYEHNLDASIFHGTPEQFDALMSR